MARKKHYVHHKSNGEQRPSYTIHFLDAEPTWESHGELGGAFIGPFRTRRGAQYMVQFGWLNPHCRCVSEAEKLGERYADAYNLNTKTFDPMKMGN